MTDDLSDKNPFADDEEVDEENLISPAMVKKVTYLIHKLAEQKGKDYKDIQKKCRNMFKYENLAKISKEQGHEIINKLIELTGGEEEEKPELPTKPDGGLKNKGAKVTDDNPTNQGEKIEESKNENKEAEKDVDVVTATMREAIRAAVDITLKEVVDKDVPVQGLGGFVLEIGKVIFDAKMDEGAKNGK